MTNKQLIEEYILDNIQEKYDKLFVLAKSESLVYFIYLNRDRIELEMFEHFVRYTYHLEDEESKKICMSIVADICIKKSPIEKRNYKIVDLKVSEMRFFEDKDLLTFYIFCVNNQGNYSIRHEVIWIDFMGYTNGGNKIWHIYGNDREKATKGWKEMIEFSQSEFEGSYAYNHEELTRKIHEAKLKSIK